MIEKNWRDLIRPKLVDIEKDTLTSSFGKFIVRPLERGFGLTLGNSLRRVLLSSLQGAGVVAVRVEGASHEFAAIPNVKEDVAEIILNLKQIRFKLHTDRSIVRLTSNSKGTLLASHLELGDGVEILNPGVVIAHLNDGANLDLEILLTQGRGYTSADENREFLPGVEWISVDTFFSPVRRVNYNVTQSRVGQRTDFDRLSMEVWTDSSVVPEDALALAAKILKDQLTVFINFEETTEVVSVGTDDVEPKFNPNLLRSVDELELSVRSANCLQNANIKTIWQLVQKTESEMLKTKNFGRKSLNEIKEILSEMGLGLGMKLEGFVPPAASGDVAVSSESFIEVSDSDSGVDDLDEEDNG